MRRVLTATMSGLVLPLGGGRAVLPVAADEGESSVRGSSPQPPTRPIALILIAGSLLFIPSIGDTSASADPPSQSDYLGDGMERGICW